MSDQNSDEYAENDISDFTEALTAYKDLISAMEKQSFALVKVEMRDGVLLTFQNCLHSWEFTFNDKVLKAPSEIYFEIEDDYSAGAQATCVYATLHLPEPGGKKWAPKKSSKSSSAGTTPT